MNPWRKLNDWLAWRGLTWNEVSYAIGALSALIGAVGFLAWVVLRGQKMPYRQMKGDLNDGISKRIY